MQEVVEIAVGQTVAGVGPLEDVLVAQGTATTGLCELGEGLGDVDTVVVVLRRLSRRRERHLCGRSDGGYSTRDGPR